MERAIVELVKVSNFSSAGLPPGGAEVQILQKMLHDDRFSDVAFQCQGVSEPIPAHRAVLACASAYFRAMLPGDWAESGEGSITVSFAADTVRAMLIHIYCGTPPALGVDLVELFKVESYFATVPSNLFLIVPSNALLIVD
jgi:hypothetical protein